ncbi:CU044_5270 family protein [Streptomyces sp. NPDC049813]|uniref:CU044_5270 family protein n=1 Tax=Streptomyces sp. NPDC049813 TaxID=3365597 RepID=UPI003792689A
MNDQHERSTAPAADAGTTDRDADLVELARLLPAPDSCDLPRAQHLRHKERLMQRIDHDQTAARPHPARRLLRPALLVPVTALALGGLLTAGVVAARDDAPATAATRQDGTSGASSAAVLLDRISLAASRGDAFQVADDQFVYTREKGRGADLTSGKAVVGPLEERETWSAQRPGPLHTLGVTRTDGGEPSAVNAELGDDGGTPAGLSRPTYHWLASLPTDPGKLLAYLYDKTPEFAGQERDQAVFEQIGSLVGALMPPETGAALYRAAAEIPGVGAAPAAHDAIGRHGVGISRDDKTFGTRTEWVFDKKDLTFLGSRSYLVKDTRYGKAGTLMSSTAVLGHAVVDKAGRAPATTRQS